MKDIVKKSRSLALGYARGNITKEVIISTISTLHPLEAATVVLNIASFLPDTEELKFRKAVSDKAKLI